MGTVLMPGLDSITIEPVADGVYAALAVPGRGSMGNGGIVDLGEETLVFDTLRTPAAAAELLHVATSLTGRAPTWVVNSHWHDDHVAGNQVFLPGTRAIIATERTRELMATRLIAEYAEDAAALPDFLRSLAEHLAAETDPERHRQLSERLAESQLYAAAIRAIQVTLPTLTVESRLTLHGTRRTVHLLAYGAGHTESDLFLYIPDDDIAFLGDLAFMDCHPWLLDGDPQAWARTLDRAEQLPLRVIIPGHGPVSDLRCVALTRDYIAALQALAQRVLDAGGSEKQIEEQLAALTIPAPFASWVMPQFFQANMRFLLQSSARGPAASP